MRQARVSQMRQARVVWFNQCVVKSPHVKTHNHQSRKQQEPKTVYNSCDLNYIVYNVACSRSGSRNTGIYA